MIAGLPYDAEVEYLESVRPAYIDTGIRYLTTYSVFLDAQFVDQSRNLDTVLGSSGDATCTIRVWPGVNQIQAYWYGGSNTLTNDVNELYKRHHYEFSPNGIMFDGNLITQRPSNHDTVESLKLAGYNEGNTERQGACRFWSFKISNGNTILMDLIPVRFTNSNGQSEGAMYDRVSRKLFRNAGKGSFTIGPDVATPVMGLHFMPKPPPYDAKVEYLESTGTEWIQLGFGFDPSDEIEASFSIDTSEKNDKYMNAARSWGAGRTFGMGVAGGGKLTMAFGNAASTSTVLVPVTFNDGAFHTWKYDNRVCSVTDLSVSHDMTGLSFTTTTTLLRLFFGYNAPTKGKIAYYKHKKNGVLMCDFIPVRFTNELGQSEGAMYDRVSKQLFRNQGTGAFLWSEKQ